MENTNWRESLRLKTVFAALLMSAVLGQGAMAGGSGTDASEFSALAAGKWKPGAVFLVTALGGIIAIPNRYQVNVHLEEDDHDLELVSPNGVLLTGKGFGVGIPFGEITFGRLDKLSGPLAAGNPLQKFQCHGLDIEIRKSKKEGVLLVAFTRGQDYMTVFDQDDALWKKILTFYGRSVHAADTCPGQR